MSSSSSSSMWVPRRQAGKFCAAGLRVLLVDDDPLCSCVIERMLKQCNYVVTTCNTVSKALDLLKENEGNFDIVMTDVYLPNEDGFKLLEIIGLQLDLPVIMMSGNGDTSIVLKGIIHGACDYLIKPVRMQELRNIWQHVIRRMGKEFLKESYYRIDESNESGKNSDSPESIAGSKKRKEQLECSDGTVNDISSLKKTRVSWSAQLHKQFVNVVNQLGLDNAVPKRILELMNVQGLTRENVASHLQKYRLYLKRLSGLEPEPCSIASFEVSTDGILGGAMRVLPKQKVPSISSGIESLNLGPGECLSQYQILQQQQRLNANRAQVLRGLGLVDTKQLKSLSSSSSSSSSSTGLQRMCSLDLQSFLKAQPSEEQFDILQVSPCPIPEDSTKFTFKTVKASSKGGRRSHKLGSSRVSTAAPRWIERTYSGSQIEELNAIRNLALRSGGGLMMEKQADALVKMESKCKSAESSCSSNISAASGVPSIMVFTENPREEEEEALSVIDLDVSSFATPIDPPIVPETPLLDVSDYLLDDDNLFLN